MSDVMLAVMQNAMGQRMVQEFTGVNLHPPKDVKSGRNGILGGSRE